MKQRSIIITAILFNLSFAVAGGSSTGTRGGGNGSAAEFIRLGTEALNSFGIYTQAHLDGRDVAVADLDKVLKAVKIVPTKKDLKIDGKSVDAINDPAKNNVTLNVDRWTKLSSENKTQLVLHELWGLTYHDHADDNYKFSTELALQLQYINAKTKIERVKAVITSARDAREHSFKATVLRAGGEEDTNLVLIIERQLGIDWDQDIVTSRVIFRDKRLPFGIASTIDNLHQTSRGFEFESVNTSEPVRPIVKCLYPLPEPPAMDELEDVELICH